MCMREHTTRLSRKAYKCDLSPGLRPQPTMLLLWLIRLLVVAEAAGAGGSWTQKLQAEYSDLMKRDWTLQERLLLFFG